MATGRFCGAACFASGIFTAAFFAAGFFTAGFFPADFFAAGFLAGGFFTADFFLGGAAFREIAGFFAGAFFLGLDFAFFAAAAMGPPRVLGWVIAIVAAPAFYINR
jgi:hypothetical protein